MLYNIIAWVVFGLIAGFIAKAIMPGRDPGGAIVTILLGIGGAIVGGFIGSALFGRNTADESFNILSLVMAVIGAIVLLAIYRLATGRNVTS